MTPDRGSNLQKSPNEDDDRSSTPLSHRARRIVLLGVIILGLSYLFPLGSVSGGWSNLLLGLSLNGYGPLGSVLLRAVRPLAMISLIVTASLLPLRDTRTALRPFRVGIIVGAGAMEVAYFLSLLGTRFATLAPWIGLIGSVLVLVGGISAIQAQRRG